MTSIDRFQLGSASITAIGGASAEAARSPALVTADLADRVVAGIVGDGAFPREDAAAVWAKLRSAATGTPPTSATANGPADDAYGIDSFARQLSGSLPGASPAEQGALLRAVDDFARAVGTQMTANRRQGAATALGPVALALADVARAQDGGAGRDLVGTLGAATAALERRLR